MIPGQFHWGIRAASSPGDGSGHLMRCVALADALAEIGDRATFFVGPEPGKLSDVPIAHGHYVHVLASHRIEDLSKALEDCHFSGLVVDGYWFDELFQSKLNQVVRVCLVLDDMVRPSRVADIILNQNLGHHPSEYNGLLSTDARLLLGLHYVLLRAEFRSLPARVIRPRANRVLVTMGGEDQQDATGMVIRALQNVKDIQLDVKVLLGLRFLESKPAPHVGAMGPHQYEIVSGLDRVDRLMAWADIGVIACGSTSWECLASGLPMIAFPIFENQRRAAREIRQRKLGMVLPDFEAMTEGDLATAVRSLLLDEMERRRLSQEGQRAVDAQGAFRVAHILRSQVGQVARQIRN